MKKTMLVILSVSICFLFLTSCSKDDEVVEPDLNLSKVSLSTTSVTMYHDQTKQLFAVNATSWSTENDFVAKVDENGLVTGCHVGTTRIIASNGSSSAVCNVTIIPKYNLYDTPILEWGISMAELKNKETHELKGILSTTSISYDYSRDSDTPCLVIYDFKDGKLYWVSVLLRWDYFPLAVDHILERYQAMYLDRVKQDAMFWDAYTKDKLKTAVLLQLTEISGSQILRINYADASIVPIGTTNEVSIFSYDFISFHKFSLPCR